MVGRLTDLGARQDMCEARQEAGGYTIRGAWSDTRDLQRTIRLNTMV
jgi:hypothetical protein